MTTTTPEYYTWTQVPVQHRTRKQWLKEHRRVKKDAIAVGTITLIFAKPRARHKDVEPVLPEECDHIRMKLMRFGLDPSDLSDLHRLDGAGQLAVINLYASEDTEEITAFTGPEAKKLLEYMIWDNSHEDHFITEATVNGQRERATWRSDFSAPSLTTHLSGERYFGVKKGQMTMQITVDLDRHSGRVCGERHIEKAVKVGEVLTRHFPEFRFCPEINPKNGSVKFFGWLAAITAAPLASQQAERVRGALQEKLPEYDFDDLEIFPSSSPQVFAPLRADKIMVIGDGIVKKIKAWRMEPVNGKRRRRYYDAYSCDDFLNWVYFSDEPFNVRVFMEQLREAVARCPDEQDQQQEHTPNERKTRHKRPGAGQGMGNIGALKGRCATTLVNFWSELATPENDTVCKFVIVTLRILKYEGLEKDEAAAWVEDRLESLKNKSFSERLSDNFAEFQRVVVFAVETVWSNNGYQHDPETSDRKLRTTVEAWARKGFVLHDSTTWAKHAQTAVPDCKLVWSPALLAVVPELATVINASHDEARTFLETVLCFVQSRSELSESIVGELLQQCNIAGRSRQKQHDTRKFLVNNGLLIKQRNYYCDQATGYRHGNFYICGLAVMFEKEAQPQPTHTVSIYLSLIDDSDGEGTSNTFNIVLERRRWACERRYQERIRRLRQVIRVAA